MESKNVDVFQELNQMQARINSLFKDLIVENEQYKSDCKEHKTKFDLLYREIDDLKKQSEIVKDLNEKLIKLFVECFNLFKLELSSLNLLKSHQPILDSFQSRFLSIITNSQGLLTSKEDCNSVSTVKVKEENPGDLITRFTFDETTIKKEIEAISVLDLSTQCFFDSQVNKSAPGNQWVLNKAKSELILEKFFERRQSENELENIRKLEEPLVRETEVLDLSHANNLISANTNKPILSLPQSNGMVTPEKNPSDRSPVFKDLGNRKPENTNAEEKDSSKLTSLRLVNEKFLLKSSDLIVSPLKRTADQDKSNSPSPKKRNTTPKRPKLNMNVPNSKRSLNNQLKKSNSREAEISASGVRKLTQTVLNMECFKVKSPEKEREDSSKENEAKTLVDADEDDVIIESPKKSEQSKDDSWKKKCKNEFVLPEINALTPPAASDVDLDVTYVNSSLIKNRKSLAENEFENVIENQTPVKRPSREISPECDSVPFVYKREPIRKKIERLKLPGHACVECDKYYKEALGKDVKTQDLKAVLNKCSRHRDKNPPMLDETPAGYWKPYLTPSTMISPGKDGTILR